MVNKVYKVSSGKEKAGSKHNQILMSIVVCMPILAYGTAMGWISPNKALLMGDYSPSNSPLSEEDVSWMASIMFIFAPIAVFVYGVAADKFGRKNALLFATLPISLGWAVKLMCAHPIALIGARALIGFGSGGGFVVCPLYVKEISEDSIRGMTGTFVIFSQVICMPILAYGTAMGWISPNKALLMGDYSPSNSPLSEEDVSWMASIMFIFAPIAVFVYGVAADKFGRKNALLFATLPISLGWAVKLMCAHPIALIGARALIGFGSGGGFVVCPLYVKEISEDSIRGMTGTFVIFSQTVGNLVVFVLGDLLPFNTVLWILLAIPLVHFCILLRLPETPSYLVKCGKNEETAKVLAWLRSLPVNDKSITEEVDRLIIEQTTSEPKFSPKLLFSDKTAVKAFWVALIVNLTREFCGCIAVLVYASHIFAEAGKDPGTSIALSPNKQSILLAAVQIIGSFLACQLVDRAGRKPLLAVTSVVAGFSMCLLGVWFYLQSIGVFMPGWVPIVALCFCIFADASGLQPLPFVIMTEMFNFQLRGTVATLIMAISLGTDFALLKLFAPLNTWIGYHFTFWIFSVICLSNVFYLIFCVPETKMRNLEDIYADLEGKKGRQKSEEQVVETNHV